MLHDRPLKDYELGAILKGLAKQNLIVFAVLDCCYSGGRDRREDNVREIDFIQDAVEDEDPSIVPPEIDPGGNDSRDGYRVDTYWTQARDYHDCRVPSEPYGKRDSQRSRCEKRCSGKDND